MATIRTPYIIGEQLSDGWIWIMRAEPWFAWAGDRKHATRFTGRKAARAFAESCCRSMAANGYPDVILQLVPAAGGLPVGKPVKDTGPIPILQERQASDEDEPRRRAQPE